MEITKETLLNTLRESIKKIQGKIILEKERVRSLIEKPLSEIKSMKPEDQAVYLSFRDGSVNRISELDHLYGSPYFIRCDISFDGATEEKQYYFSKHQFVEQSIYSWIAPIASIRFDSPGEIQYRLPDGTIRKGVMNHKEQYLIVDGKVVFFATEGLDRPRDLIHQEYFSQKKDGFMLPEIVAVMEKAQDKVIRAHHKGPLVISGPAGSGKTTLALHRLAYLVQSPDTSHLYPANSIIVFVQDNGTKEYFSHLLPELGITNIRITTFFEWASEILGIADTIYLDRRGKDEEEKNVLEFERIRQLKSHTIPTWNEMKKFLKKESKTGLDRIDLIAALTSYYNHHKKFQITTNYLRVEKGVEYTGKVRKELLEYSLIVVDEFQNYMPEQLLFFNSCLNSDTKSLIYVGDIAQQIFPGTVRSFHEAELKLDEEREVKLHKVYRNTLQILEYIRSLGYLVEIPQGIKNGPDVKENIISEKNEVIKYLDEVIKNNSGLVGILGYVGEDIEYIRDHFKDNKKVYVRTVRESQGVEFDTVCLVGICNDLFSIKTAFEFPEEYIKEKKRIQKDLLYVALTRAVNELHIIGECTLREIMPELK